MKRRDENRGGHLSDGRRKEAAARGHVQPAGRCCCSRFPDEVLKVPHRRRQKLKASSLGASSGAAAALQPSDSATIGTSRLKNQYLFYLLKAFQPGELSTGPAAVPVATWPRRSSTCCTGACVSWRRCESRAP